MSYRGVVDEISAAAAAAASATALAWSAEFITVAAPALMVSAVWVTIRCGFPVAVITML